MLQWDLDYRPVFTRKMLEDIIPYDSEKPTVFLVRSMGFFSCVSMFPCPVLSVVLRTLHHTCLFVFIHQFLTGCLLLQPDKKSSSWDQFPSQQSQQFHSCWKCLTVPGRLGKSACDNKLSPVTFLKNSYWVSLSCDFPLVLSNIVNKQWVILMMPCKFWQCPQRIPSTQS